MVCISTNRAAAPYSPTSARLPKGASIKISLFSIINFADIPTSVGAAIAIQIRVCGADCVVLSASGKRGRIQ